MSQITAPTYVTLTGATPDTNAPTTRDSAPTSAAQASSRASEASPKTSGEASPTRDANGTYERDPASLLAG